MSNKQLSLPGLPILEPKEKKRVTHKGRRVGRIEDRLRKLELEVSLINIRIES